GGEPQGAWRPGGAGANGAARAGRALGTIPRGAARAGRALGTTPGAAGAGRHPGPRAALLVRVARLTRRLAARGAEHDGGDAAAVEGPHPSGGVALRHQGVGVAEQIALEVAELEERRLLVVTGDGACDFLTVGLNAQGHGTLIPSAGEREGVHAVEPAQEI